MLDRDLANASPKGPFAALARTPALALMAACIILGACGGAQTEPQPSGQPAKVEPPSEPENTELGEDAAMLDIIAERETEILLDGKPIGKTPLSDYKVVPGSHDVTFVDEKNGNRTMSVSVGPNEAITVKSDAPPQIQEAPAEDDKKKK